MNELNSVPESQLTVLNQTEATDAQLVMRYTGGQDQAAFAALLERHGPLVFGICRRILRNHHAAEDAFQATFLCLARNASRIAKPEQLANWLHSVARHASLKVNKTVFNSDKSNNHWMSRWSR